MINYTVCSRSFILGEWDTVLQSKRSVDSFSCFKLYLERVSVLTLLASFLPGLCYCSSVNNICPLIMWIYKLAVSFVLSWTVLSLLIYPAATLIQYLSAELLQLRIHQSAPPPVLQYFPDIVRLPHRRYIHRGATRSYHIDDSNAINSIWSSSRHHPPRNASSPLPLL